MNTVHVARRQIQARFAATVEKETGLPIEATIRSDCGWTVSGTPAAVEAAVAFLTSAGLMTHNSTEYDDELGESFAYLTAR